MQDAKNPLKILIKCLFTVNDPIMAAKYGINNLCFKNPFGKLTGT
jgi:hypothetical protein